MPIPRVRALQQQISAKNDELSMLRIELTVAQGEEYYQCGGCLKRTRVKNLVAISKHYYVTPHGCMGGDYWRFSEFVIFCHKCNAGMRILDKGQSSWVSERLYQFKERFDWHPQKYVDPAWDTFSELVDFFRHRDKKKAA